MNERRIIAQNITNLTDARYFAAWGVDYLSYNIIPDSPFHIGLDQVEEIKAWVEGPATLIESNTIEFLEICDGLILDNIYSSLPVNKETFFRIDIMELEKGLPSGKYIIAPTLQELDLIRKMDISLYNEADMYMEISNLPLNTFNNWPEWGLVVQGGEEEKVGVKSFDDLDILYDLLFE